ncbi:hypothetical protein [Kitasatospora viridis]|uniref:Uncharacterized protein n=1 Tax=Kitasatospora viridis TaxID=281105 RepID=A0A561UKZ7_9ACTN|nr:hypothetical protein [Kitasatospora viridis]TWG00033.1 hypothetical protein FHX73_113899 [Kitasatospora viridis]
MSDQYPYGPPPPAAPDGYGAPPPQPGYGSPVYPQQSPYYQQVPPQQGAGWPAQYPPVGPPPPPPRRSRKALWITLVAVLAAIGVASSVLVSTLKDKSDKQNADKKHTPVVQQSPAASGTPLASDSPAASSSPGGTQDASGPGTRKLVVPDSFQTLSSDPGNKLAQQLSKNLSQSQGAKSMDGTVSTVYNSLLSDRAVVYYGDYGRIASPSLEEVGFWLGFENSARGNGATFSARTHPDPGPLGGVMSCEDAITTKETDAVCVWIDNSVLAVVMQTTASGKAPALDKAAADARELRGSAEVPK